MNKKNTGNYNTGYCNTGNCNTGDYNTGYYNTGYCNTGNCNTGNCNTGDCNTGNCNTGNCNTGDYNTGYCNTITPDECFIFNKKGSREEWNNAIKPDWMFFSLTEWVSEENMTDKEKEAYPSYITTGGYLKVFTSYKHAAIESWNRTSQEDKELTLKLPNFDDKVFEEIFGFSAIEQLQKKKVKVKIEDEEFEISQEQFEQFKKQIYLG